MQIILYRNQDDACPRLVYEPICSFKALVARFLDEAWQGNCKLPRHDVDVAVADEDDEGARGEDGRQDENLHSWVDARERAEADHNAAVHPLPNERWKADWERVGPNQDHVALHRCVRHHVIVSKNKQTPNVIITNFRTLYWENFSCSNLGQGSMKYRKHIFFIFKFYSCWNLAV